MRMLLRRVLALAFLPLALAGVLPAQGSDACATPTAIAGLGTFPFDTTAATTGTQGQYNCSGQFGIDRDVWFAWVAPSSGSATMSLCGGASFDTKIAAYPSSGCPGSRR